MSMRPLRAAAACALALSLAACGNDSSTGSSVTVTCSASPTSGFVPLAVNFRATPSGGDGKYTILWSFGDGTGSAEPVATRTFGLPGTYNASVQVQSAGQRASCSQTVVAQTPPPPTLPPNKPPVAAFKVNPNPPTGTHPFDVELNACQSSDPEKDPLVFTFDPGTGAGPKSQAHCRKLHTYEAAGTYKASVCVNDGYPGHVDQCQGYTVVVN